MIVASLLTSCLLGSITGFTPTALQPATAVFGQEPMISIVRGQVRTREKLQAVIWVQASNDTPVQIVSISIDGVGEDRSPLVVVATQDDEQVYETGTIPSRASVPEGAQVVLIGQFPIPPMIQGSMLVTVVLADGTILTREVRPVVTLNVRPSQGSE